MRRYLRLLALFARTELQFALEYRVNLLLEIGQMLIVVVTSVGAVLILYAYTQAMNGWTLEQMIVLLGVYYIVQGVEELVLQPSFERFMEHVREGTLDFILLKPISSQFMVSFRHFQTVQTLQVLVGVAITVYGVARLAAVVTPATALAFAVTLVCGFVLIYALLLVLSTFAFWFVRVDNLLAIFWAFIDAGRFPIDIYPGWLRVTMSTVVPVGIAVTVPAKAIVGLVDAPTLAAVVAATVIAWVVSRAFWKIGVRSYTGASA
ncbi:MAG: ABC-2 family transporter protein [Chloroflexota bacterium]|nr:ABC-2 family transporter protein [Chloroflexota bacterium]MDE3192706.1 ABC-2 family transporter protein [Chloroflexota bacterium]